jgi:hypothetical protein
LARLVLEAKMSLAEGEWAEFWARPEMPFPLEEAERLRRIAGAFVDIHARTAARLPHDWAVLDELAKLDRAALIAHIAEGRVHPRLTLEEAARLVTRPKSEPA